MTFCRVGHASAAGRGSPLRDAIRKLRSLLRQNRVWRERCDGISFRLERLKAASHSQDEFLIRIKLGSRRGEGPKQM